MWDTFQPNFITRVKLEKSLLFESSLKKGTESREEAERGKENCV